MTPNAAVQGAETAATPLLRLPCNGMFGVKMRNKLTRLP
jgi:hypothetical protein